MDKNAEAVELLSKLPPGKTNVVTESLEGIALAREHGDNATRALLEPMLVDTEQDHILWLESQLRQIEDMGVENYLQQQI